MPRQNHRIARKRRLFLELLETRRCLTWTLAMDGAVLIFTGTAGADTLTDIQADATTGMVIYGDEVNAANSTAFDEADVSFIHIYGLGGNDTINLAGSPELFTNEIHFAVWGGTGNDEIWGPQKTTLAIGTGHILRGEAGDDLIQGGDGDDFIEGGNNIDTEYLFGNDGDDIIYGGGVGAAGDAGDEIDGGDDDDILYGNIGEDKHPTQNNFLGSRFMIP